MIQALAVELGSNVKPDPYLAALLGDWGLGLDPKIKFGNVTVESGFSREELAAAVAEVEGKARKPHSVPEDLSLLRGQLAAAAAAAAACVNEALGKRAVDAIQRQVLAYLDLGPSWREGSLIVLRAVGSLGKLCKPEADVTARAVEAASSGAMVMPSSRVLVVVYALAAAAAAWALWRVLR